MWKAVIAAGAVAAWLSTVSGCKPHDELVVDVMCQTLCPCFVPTDEVAECIDECSTDLDPTDVSDLCFHCVLDESSSCARLADRCDPFCQAFRSPP